MSWIILTVLAVCSTAVTGCIDGWTAHEEFCYLFSHNQATWAEAATFCREFQSYLAEPVTAEIDHFLGTQAMTNGRKYWVGGTDLAKEGTWMWMSSFTKFTYTNWIAPDPNNANAGEDCLVYNWFHRGGWADYDCEHQEYYICQQENENFVGVG